MHSVSSVTVDHILAVASSLHVTNRVPSSLKAMQLMDSSWSPIVSLSRPFLLLEELPFPILFVQRYIVLIYVITRPVIIYCRKSF